MNYDEARQRKDGRWDWTSRNGDHIHPVGYCAGWMDWTAEQAERVAMPLEYLQKEQERKDGPFRQKFHTDGHATQEEAERCFYEYCLDHAAEREWDQAQQCDFPGCETFTRKTLHPQFMGSVVSFTHLCDEHRNREGLQAARPFRGGMEVMHS